MAISVLSLGVLAISGGLDSSAVATGQSQTRLIATEIASQAIQEAESLNPATLAEGIDCTSGGATATCDSAASPDPLVYGGSSNPCWYYGPVANGLLVPTVSESSSNDAPLIPNVPPPVTQDGIPFVVATYPYFNTAQGGYPAVSCASLANESAPNVPVTVLVQVSWGPTNSRQQVSLQTLIYAPPPPPVQSQNSCQGFSTGAGAHLEALLATPAPSNSTQLTPGHTASIYFLDEKPALTAPAFCVVDVNGNTNQIPVTVSVTYYGSGSANPFLPSQNNSTVIQAVDPSYGASGPNAADPPAGGTYCSTGYTPPNSIPGPQTPTPDPPNTCNLEVELSFTVPWFNTNGLNISSITIGVWDHEQDLDSYTWQVGT